MSALNKRSVGQILKAMGAVDDVQIQKALEYATANNVKIGEAFVKTSACNQMSVSKALAKHWNLPFANLGKAEVKKEILALVPKDVAIDNAIVPVTRKNGTLVVAMKGLDLMVLDNLRFLLSQQVDAAIATPEDIEEALDHYYRLTGDLSQVIGEQEQVEWHGDLVRQAWVRRPWSWTGSRVEAASHETDHGCPGCKHLV